MDNTQDRSTHAQAAGGTPTPVQGPTSTAGGSGSFHMGLTSERAPLRPYPLLYWRSDGSGGEEYVHENRILIKWVVGWLRIDGAALCPDCAGGSSE